MAAPPTIQTADGIDALKFFATTTEVTVHREGESPVFGESAALAALRAGALGAATA